jgi:MFS family permease
MPSRRKRNTSRLDSSESATSTQQHDEDKKELEQVDEPLSWFVIQVTAVASLGGVLFGYDIGVIASALPQMTLDFDLSHRDQELVVSFLYLGGGIGAAVGGGLCDAFGRKRAIVLTDIVFLIGALVLYSAQSVSVVILGRIIVGFAVAVSGLADVSYLHEMSPPAWRGAVVSCNEACISLGFLLAFGVGSLNNISWRAMFGVSGIVAGLQLVGMLGLPESPTWLKQQTRLRQEEEEEEETELSSSISIHSVPVVVSYDSVTRETIPPLTNYTDLIPDTNRGWAFCRCYHYYYQCVYLFKSMQTFGTDVATRYRRQAYIALVLATTQQFCGQTNVLSYATVIFASISRMDSTDFVGGRATLAIGVVKFLVTLVVIWKIEAIGRRQLLLIGMSTISLGLLLLALAFTGFSGEEQEETIVGGGRMYIALPGVLMVVCGYSMSFGPLTWLLTSELFPTDMRGRALGASTIVTYTCAAMVSSTFLSAQAWLGPSVVFCTYLVITLCGIVFCHLAIPELPLPSNEIDAELDKMSWWRTSTIHTGTIDSSYRPPLLPAVS